MVAPPAYAELHCLSNFSFLRGASHPEELVQRAAELGYSALALTDECSVAGVVRAHLQARHLGLKLLIGSEFTLADGPRVVLLAPDRAAYGDLCEIITAARRGAKKGAYRLTMDDLAAHAGRCLALWLPDSEEFHHYPLPPPLSQRERGSMPAEVERLCGLFPGRLWLAVERWLSGRDRERLAALQALGERFGVPLVAAGGVQMHKRRRKRLHDVLTAIRLGTTVEAAGLALAPNGERCLRSRAMLAQLYPPALLEETVRLAARCAFSLDELRYEYPDEIVPAGETPASYLRRLTEEGMRRRWPQGAPPKVRELVERELVLIAELRYEPYFLTVYDIVHYARAQNILCQGRGSAANSAVCFCLGITEVDPDRIDTLFERFISKERDEPPDIDVDFEHERREEVIQYVYAKYGRQRAALAATVITYRARSAVRDVGKALGFSLEQVDRLAKNFQWWDGVSSWSVDQGGGAHPPPAVDSRRGAQTPAHPFGGANVHRTFAKPPPHPPQGGREEKPEEGEAVFAARLREAGFDPDNPRLKLLVELVQQLRGFPRHLSQHVGGFVIARDSLERLVPIENAAMPERTVIQWDKNDIEALGLLKVDCLGLGMLTVIHKAFDLIERRDGRALTMAALPPEDPKVYEMIAHADTVGVFQIESRAQMSMLPRLKPRCFYDLVIEIAIVRPGPIQGNMVHPYLRRRNQDPSLIKYPSADVKAVLARTLGVPIFQEQVIKLAMVAAGFSAGEADGLRRAMAAWHRRGGLEVYEARLIDGMRARGYTEAFARQIFEQIKGFGEYGFPESHSASFALLAYVSAWLKHYEPAVFLAALLNSQPMGFYQPAQLVQDARRHGVEVRPVDVRFSDWDCTLEPMDNGCTARPLQAGSLRGHASGRSNLEETAEPVPSAAEGSLRGPKVRSNLDEIASSHKPLLAIADSGDARRVRNAHHLFQGERYTQRTLHVNNLKEPELEGTAGSAVRLGLRHIKGMSRAGAERLVTARSNASFTDVADMVRRAALDQRDRAALASSGALKGLAGHRHRARWAIAGIEPERPLLAQTAIPEAIPLLRPPTEAEDLLADYAHVGLTLGRHPLALLRAQLAAHRSVPAVQVNALPHGRNTRTAGIVVCRQHPGSAKGVIFLTLEDETGQTNIVVWPSLVERYRRALVQARLLFVDGEVQREGEVLHVVARRLEDRSALLGSLVTRSRDFQ